MTRVTWLREKTKITPFELGLQTSGRNCLGNRGQLDGACIEFHWMVKFSWVKFQLPVPTVDICYIMSWESVWFPVVLKDRMYFSWTFLLFFSLTVTHLGLGAAYPWIRSLNGDLEINSLDPKWWGKWQTCLQSLLLNKLKWHLTIYQYVITSTKGNLCNEKLARHSFLACKVLGNCFSLRFQTIFVDILGLKSKSNLVPTLRKIQ